MALRDVLLAILAVMLVTLAPAAVLRGSRTMRLPREGASTWAAGVIVALLLASLFVRSGGFGVDTVTYADLLGDYCRGQAPDEQELSYQASLMLINAGMLGACDVSWLTAVWAFIIGALLLCLPLPWPLRLRYAALLLFSLIGIELTTNALRQGLSMATCVLGIALWRRRPVAALPFAAAALVLHSSTALVLLAVVLATLPWRWFLLGLALSVGAVMFFIQNGVEPSLLQPLLMEIQKYMAHEDDELWVRVLAFASVVAALAAPWLTARGQRRVLLSSRFYAIALRVGLCSVPFLGLPYFGYRIIYGLYPITLYFTLLTGPREGVRPGRHFALLLGFNALLLLTWAHGSAYMREVPFFD